MSFSKVTLNLVKTNGGAVKSLRTFSGLEFPVSIFHSASNETKMAFNVENIGISWWKNLKGYLKTLISKYKNKTSPTTKVAVSNFKKDEAVQLNKMAIRQAKQGSVERTYPKASQEDLRRLTSETIEDSYSRVEYINPKDGKIYNLLKQGETEDGKILVRILDEEGAFIKEVQVIPKKIAVLDDFGVEKMEHGDQVLAYARRYNPFAAYTKLEYNSGNFPKKICDLIRTLENNHYDYINLSSGEPIRILNIINLLKQLSPKELSKIGLNKKMQKNLKLDKRKIEELRDFYIKALREYPELSKSNAENELILYLDSLKNTRVLVASGNNFGFGFLNNKYLYIGKNLEGVGSLSSEGKISQFSSSRNKGYTKHYEVGESKFRETPYGYNFTGKAGTDAAKSVLPYNSIGEKFAGTSFATPIRTAKLALNEMMEGIL